MESRGRGVARSEGLEWGGGGRAVVHEGGSPAKNAAQVASRSAAAPETLPPGMGEGRAAQALLSLGPRGRPRRAWGPTWGCGGGGVGDCSVPPSRGWYKETSIDNFSLKLTF